MIIRRENIQITIVQWRINILLGVESTTTKNHWHKIYWNKFKLSLHTLIICNKVTNNQSVAFICQIFTKINKQVGIHQTKNLLHSKRNNQQNEWDNIFINRVSDEWIDEEFIQLKSKKANNLSEKWAQELNRQFFKEDTYGHQVHEERLYIMKHQENADQNEISLHNW